MNDYDSEEHKQAVLVDFDDTILHTTGYKEVEYAFWQGQSSDYTKERMREYVKDYNAGKFHVFRPQDFMTQNEWRRTLGLIKLNVPKLLHRDALDFINRNRHNFSLYILTFGDREFQEAKVLAAGLDIPAIYTEQKSKANAIKEWWRGDHYEINGEKFSDIILIDDRTHSFDDFDKLTNAKGVLVRRKISRLGFNDDTTRLPVNVVVVDSMNRIDL